MSRRTKGIKVLIAFFVITGSYAAWLYTQYTVPIVMYHSINYAEKTTGIQVDPENFRRQMEFLKKNKFNVITLNELVTAITENRKLARNSVVITFDDGYEDNYTQAFKILKEYGFPATFFVIADVAGQEGYITWPQAREMEKSGMTIGSHTLDHVYLPGTPPAWQHHQIADSKKILEEKLGHKIDFFCYPSGGFNEKIKEIVKHAGYRAACTTNRGYVPLNQDVYELKRIRLKNKEKPLTLRTKLSGYYNFFKRPKDPN